MMPVYLGSLGRMIKLPYVGSQQVQTEERYTFQHTLEGRRKAQTKPVGRRTWALSADHFRPNEHSLLSQFANGAWGSGPFVFVPADAPHTNMLTPAVSMCDPAENYESGVVPGGAMLQPDGSWAARSYMRAAPGLFLFGRVRYPIPDRGPVSAGVTVLGAGAVARITWYGVAADGGSTILGHSRSAEPGVGTEARRLSVTAQPPQGTVGCIVGVENGLQVSAPSLVWGSAVPAWAEGQGCVSAVVHAVSRDLVLAVPGATYSNVGFTVTEVG